MDMGLTLDEGVGGLKPTDFCCVFSFDNYDIREEDQPLDVSSLLESRKEVLNLEKIL
jgi:hypothetical protein